MFEAQRATARTPVGRALALIVVSVLLVGLSQAQSRDERRGDGGPAGAIPVPANPAAVKGTWTVGGQARSITEGEFHAVHSLLNRAEGTSQQGVTDMAAWEYVLLSSEADAFGIVVTDAELDAATGADEPELYEGLVARWRTQGISEAEGRDYTRTSAKINKLKDLVLNNTRITTQEAFDSFKQNHLLYKLEYLLFTADDYMKPGDVAVADELTLRTFWSENRALQQEFRSAATVSAQIVYLDPENLTVEDAEAMAGGSAVSRKEALDYFWKNRQTLVREVPPTKQHLLTLDDGKKLEDIVSPFAVLEDTIKKTLLLEKLVDRAHEEARAAGASPDLEALARKYRLGYQRVTELDRPASVNELRRFGFQIFNVLQAAPDGEVSPTVFAERQVRYFYRLDAKVASRLPEFDEIKDAIRRRYAETNASDKARTAAQEVIDALNAKVAQQIEPLETRLAQEADEAAAARIAQLGITKEVEKNRERMRARASVRPQIEAEKKTLFPKYFDEYLTASGLSTSKTDYFEFDLARQDRTQVEDRSESRLLFLRTNYSVRSLKAGEMAPLLIEDPITRSFFIVRMLDQRDPDMSTMGPVDLMQARALLSQIKESNFMRRWRYGALQKRLGLERRDR